jgi:hypothetical protein
MAEQILEGSGILLKLLVSLQCDLVEGGSMLTLFTVFSPSYVRSVRTSLKNVESMFVALRTY